MATLERIEIFGSGRHNDKDFDGSSIDELAYGFEQEQLAGKLPVKLGHNAPDTAPAAGWITKVWCEGEKLLATVSDVPDDVMQGIRDGRWRFCSVELLRDVKTSSGRMYRWLLDGLALLGSARPAVSGLKPLNESLNCSTPGVTFGERFAFTVSLEESRDLRRENEHLRARLHRQTIDAQIEGDVRARVVMAAAREQFHRLFKLTDDDASYGRVTPRDWQVFAASQRPPPSNRPATHSADWGGSAPDATLVAMTRQYMSDNAVRHLQLTGERLTFDRAATLLARDVAYSNPTLLRAYIEQPGETD